uniref:Uncharacterized protein n=1 Tax=Anguilla anguilla TaxID=7936 RepID=A0A0E9WU63_ANGAN
MKIFFPGVASLPKFFPWVQQQLIQEVTNDPRRTSKDLQVSLASAMVSDHDSTIRKRVGKNWIHGRLASS